VTEDQIRAYLAPRTKEEGDCLLWQKSLTSTGVPAARFGGRAGSCKPVRRWILEELNGPIGLLRARMTCRNTLCVEPSHLRAMTPAQVNRDMAKCGSMATPEVRASRRRNARLRSPLTIDDVRKIRALRESGLSLQKIANQFPVCKSTISKICRNESWVEGLLGSSVFNLGTSTIVPTRIARGRPRICDTGRVANYAP
jgi:hypothetical protein